MEEYKKLVMFLYNITREINLTAEQHERVKAVAEKLILIGSDFYKPKEEK